MLKFSSIMIGSDQPKVLAEFYQKVFGKPADMVDGDWHGWALNGFFLSVGAHSEVKGKAPNPQRMMFNFESKEVPEEFERIKKIGASVIKEPYQIEKMWIATLADPDGNYFQLMSPWE